MLVQGLSVPGESRRAGAMPRADPFGEASRASLPLRWVGSSCWLLVLRMPLTITFPMWPSVKPQL